MSPRQYSSILQHRPLSGLPQQDKNIPLKTSLIQSLKHNGKFSSIQILFSQESASLWQAFSTAQYVFQMSSALWTRTLNTISQRHVSLRPLTLEVMNVIIDNQKGIWHCFKWCCVTLPAWGHFNIRPNARLDKHYWMQSDPQDKHCESTLSLQFNVVSFKPVYLDISSFIKPKTQYLLILISRRTWTAITRGQFISLPVLMILLLEENNEIVVIWIHHVWLMNIWFALNGFKTSTPTWLFS